LIDLPGPSSRAKGGGACVWCRVAATVASVCGLPSWWYVIDCAPGGMGEPCCRCTVPLSKTVCDAFLGSLKLVWALVTRTRCDMARCGGSVKWPSRAPTLPSGRVSQSGIVRVLELTACVSVSVGGCADWTEWRWVIMTRYTSSGLNLNSLAPRSRHTPQAV
jgi:hypothetical protein